MSRSTRTAIAMFAGVSLAACGGGDGGGDGTTLPPTPVVLEIVSGDGQGGLPGFPLREPLVVRATQGGAAAASTAITFTASAGTLEGASVKTTDPLGYVEARWILPESEDAIAGARVTVRPTSGDGAAVSFGARRMRRDEQDLLLVPGGLGPVRLLVYPSLGFSPTGAYRTTFSDSLILPPFDPSWNEVTVFAPGRGPAMTRVTWTPGRDTVRVEFPGMVRLPLTVWVVEPPFDSTMKLVNLHIDGVKQTWEALGSIGLGDVRIVDATGFPEAPRFQGTSPNCSPEVATAIGRDAGRLNMYYLGRTSIGEIIPSASYCGGGWMEAYPLAWQRWGSLLAHEIGHGLLGVHHETVPNNIMHFRGEGWGLTPGQLFVAHYWEGSILNTMFNAHPASQRRPCVTLNPPSSGGACLSTGWVFDF